MTPFRTASAAWVILLALIFHGCSSQAGRTPGDGDAGVGVPADEGAALQRNLTDAEILVESVERGEGNNYALSATVLTVFPSGGSTSIAETGQRITLRPYFTGGTPDLTTPANQAEPGQRRLMELAAVEPGQKIRCRIALDSRGTWRIISAD